MADVVAAPERHICLDCTPKDKEGERNWDTMSVGLAHEHGRVR